MLCDTNILSELARPQPNAGVQTWADRLTTIVLSVITVEEVYYGLAAKPNARIQAWMEQFLAEQVQILPITREIAQGCGQLRGQLHAKGLVRSQADMLIAATAQVHQLTLVTRNTRDFEGCGVGLLNPFV